MTTPVVPVGLSPYISPLTLQQAPTGILNRFHDDPRDEFHLVRPCGE